MLLKPKNWGVFQHYKNRLPPWIKLHRELLNDRQFMKLPIASKALAPMLWLLASEHKEGIFDASVDELHFRLRIDEKDIKAGVKGLIDNGFFVIVSEVLAECYQDATPEREGETETEKETEKKIRAPRFDAVQHLVSLGVFEQVARDYCQQRKKKPTITAIDGIYKQAQKAGISLNNALEICCARGWEGFKADWIKDKPQQGQQLTAYQQSIKSAGISIFGNLEDHYAERNITPVAGRLGSKDI
jgi:hypothetical protein